MGSPPLPTARRVEETDDRDNASLTLPGQKGLPAVPKNLSKPLLKYANICLRYREMKRSKWEKRERVHYQTIWRWFKPEVLPVGAEQLETGTILAQEQSEVRAGGIFVHQRVSNSDQKFGPRSKACAPGRIRCEDKAVSLVQVRVDLLASFCAKVYGRRSAKNRAKGALEVIEKTK